jgi:hypothetical protein
MFNDQPKHAVVMAVFWPLIYACVQAGMMSCVHTYIPFAFSIFDATSGQGSAGASGHAPTDLMNWAFHIATTQTKFLTVTAFVFAVLMNRRVCTLYKRSPGKSPGRLMCCCSVAFSLFLAVWCGFVVHGQFVYTPTAATDCVVEGVCTNLIIEHMVYNHPKRFELELHTVVEMGSLKRPDDTAGILSDCTHTSDGEQHIVMHGWEAEFKAFDTNRVAALNMKDVFAGVSRSDASCALSALVVVGCFWCLTEMNLTYGPREKGTFYQTVDRVCSMYPKTRSASRSRS